MAMNSNKHKISSILFTTLIIFTLVLMGPASAITINIGEPNDANQGEDVQFQVSVDLDTPDMYLPIAYTTLIFTNPDNTQFECRVYNDGSTNCDNIEVIVTSNLTYGQGIQYGYGYGYGYGYEYTHFGYGYGYGYAGENGQMTYDVTLHLESDSQIGDYAVRAETYVASEDSINSEYSPCEIMLGMYRTHYVLINQEGSYYDPELDLNEDGTIDLSDIVVFATNYSGDAELFGRFQEFMRFNGDQTFNPALDLNGDGIINLSDIVLFASNQEESWCAVQLDLIDEGVERTYVSDEVEFTVSSVPVEQSQTGNYGGGRSSGGNNQPVADVEPVEEQNAEDYNNPETSTGDKLETSTGDENIGFFSGFFSAITGAVVGAGESLGLGETMYYLFALFLLGMIVVGIARRFRKKSE